MSAENLTDLAYRHFIESVKDYAIYMLNADGNVMTWNEGAYLAKGYTRAEVVGKYYGFFYSEADQNSELPARNLETARRNGKFEGEGWRFRKDGRRFWAHVVIDAIYDEHHNLLGFTKITRNISQQKEVIDRLSWMVRFDSLTGLPNRVAFFAFIEKILLESDHSRVAVCTIDLDKFKNINDTLGHLVGDQLLQHVSTAVQKVLRNNEIVARFGGDEFVAAMPYNQESELLDFTERLCASFSGKQHFAQTEINLSASIGVAIYPDDATEINKLISNSDLAMFRAKENLDNKICWYEKDMDEKTRQRNMLAADIRRGIKEGEFFIHYQAKRAIKDKSITGYEALLRWNHPTKGLLPPDIFIPIAEESGAIVPLGYWVIEAVCNESLASNLDKKISINISPVQLRNRNFIEKVQEIIVRTAWPVTLLEFEVTETAFIVNKKQAFTILNQLQKMGISIALDDFGTGYSSLSTLREFQFDVIKLDRSFLTHLENNQQARSFVRAIISLGNSINTPLIAEGVETQAQLRILEEEGCTEIQGFLFGQPVDISQVHR